MPPLLLARALNEWQLFGTPLIGRIEMVATVSS